MLRRKRKRKTREKQKRKKKKKQCLDEDTKEKKMPLNHQPTFFCFVLFFFISGSLLKKTLSR